MAELVAAVAPVRVLVVDDDRRVRVALTDLFEAAGGFEVVGSEDDVEGAMSAVRALAPDVAVVDVLLPDVESGLALLRRLSDHGLRVIALSAQDAVRSRALEAGALGFLHKGSPPEAILAAVESLAAPRLLTADVVYPESPRWHDGRLWVSDVHAYVVKAVAPTGAVTTVVEVPGRPAGLGFLPDGRLIVAGALDRCLWVWDGAALELFVDLTSVATGLLNDLVVDGAGNAYVGDTGFNLMAGEPPRPGRVVRVSALGEVRVVRDDVEFPNGAAISADGTRYWLCETVAQRVSVFDLGPDGDLTNRRTLVDLPDLCDGLCLDEDGAVWVALLRQGEFWRVRPDSTVDRVISADGRLAVACVLGGPGRRTLFLCSADTTMPDLARGQSKGLVHNLRVRTPGAGWP
jgi:sugar lactone lactonase YvrE